MILICSLLVGILLCISPLLAAQVILDGTLGPQFTLKGPHFQITAELGQRYGNNLFHSFETFNLKPQQQATFSGPASIENVISRVTGGQPSYINGLLRSTFPQADMYFLNPAGLFFGDQAQLDVQGSFHATTAHYLRLGAQGRFDARQPHRSLLTIAPVTAFGFIDESIAPIHISGQGLETTALQVPSGETLSFIGGALELNTSTFSQKHDNPSLLKAAQGRINLAGVASTGEVRLTPSDLEVSSFNQLAPITLTNQATLDVSGSGGGQVFIRGAQFFAHDSQIMATTDGAQQGGVVDIQAQNVALTAGSIINTDTQSSGQGANIRIQATESVELSGKNSAGSGSRLVARSSQNGSAGKIMIDAQTILLKDAAYLSVDTSGRGQGGQIILTATGGVTLLSDGQEPLTELSAGSTYQHQGAGQGGSIVINAQNIILKDGAIIDIAARGQGNAGQIHLNAEDNIRLVGTGSSAENSSKIKAYARMDSTGGHGGDVFLTANHILMADGAYINASTFGPGDAGNITLRARGSITLTGAKQEGWGTWIGSGSHARIEGVQTGMGGNIRVEAQELHVSNGATIASSSVAAKGMASRQAGNIEIRVSGGVYLTGINPFGETEDGLGSGIYVRSRGIDNNAGNGGTLYLQAGALTLKQGAVISSSTSGHAQGGNIHIDVQGPICISGDSAQIPLQPPGEVQLDYQAGFEDYTPKDSVSGIYAASTSMAAQAGEAGQITVSAQSLHLTEQGTINTATHNAGGGDIDLTVDKLLYVRQGEIITSVHGGEGNGGNINITDPLIVILDKGEIKAQADAGHGGDIKLKAEQFIASTDSVVNASSRLGIDGDIVLNSPSENVSSSLVIIPTDFIATESLYTQCHQRYQATKGIRLIVKLYSNHRPSPGDLQPSQ